MQLIQVLLPLCDNEGYRFPSSKYRKVKLALSRKFQGLTAYSRVAAEGLWKKGSTTRHDDIVVYEVMTPTVERKWWKNYQKRLQAEFLQESIVIRAQKISVI